jgi:hypothetical protein
MIRGFFCTCLQGMMEETQIETSVFFLTKTMRHYKLVICMTTSVCHAYPVKEFLQSQPNLNCSFIHMLRKYN